MAILIDGDMMQAGEPQIEDEKEKPTVVDPLDVLGDPGHPPATAEITSILQGYVEGLQTFIQGNQGKMKGVKQFDPSLVKPYCPHLCFGSKLEAGVRDLSRQEYLGILKDTSPDLWNLLNSSDLKEGLPEYGIDIYSESSFKDVPQAIGIIAEPGREAMQSLQESTRNIKIIPDMKFLSLFMERGQEFRDYLSKSNFSESGELFVYCKQLTTGPAYGRSFPNSKTEKNIPDSTSLFSPDKLLHYIQETGSKEIRGMMQEYEEIIKYLKGGNAGGGKMKPMYDCLKKANPGLAI